MLLEHADLSASDAVERLVGLQAQNPQDPYFALWSRLHDFRAEELSKLLEQRRVVRAALLRATVHLISANDYLTIRPLMQPLTRRTLNGSQFGKNVRGLDESEIVAEARRLLDERPRTRAELGRAMQERWPERDAESLGIAATYLLPLVQIPPRGLWRRSGQAVWATVESWLGEPLRPAADIDALMLRYLAAFGPASAADARVWSGITGLTEVFARLKPKLRAFKDETGAELYDLPDAPRPSADEEAPALFLPVYDNITLSHARRDRIVSAAARKMPGVNLDGTFLLDGFVAGSWKLERGKASAELRLRPVARLTRAQRKELEAEGDCAEARRAKRTRFVAGARRAWS